MLRKRLTTGAVAAWLSVILLPAAASAQSAITGLVKDSSGGVLPGVAVEAASPALIEKVRTSVTDAQGRYAIIDLRPGVYKVTFTIPGFSTFTFLCPASCLGQRPLCDSATPGGTASVKVTRITRRPVSFATTAWSPSARPRLAASAGWIQVS